MKQKQRQGFSLLEVLIACMVLGIIAAVAMPSAWKFYRQAAVEYEAEHLLSDLRRIQAMSRLSGEDAWNYGAKSSQSQLGILQLRKGYSYLALGSTGVWYSSRHNYLPAIYIEKKSNNAQNLSVFFDANGKPIKNSMMTLVVACRGYPQEGRAIIISRSGRIRMERGSL